MLSLIPDPRTPIPVIAGPTASGKTAIATVLASLASVEFVSADSRQIYRGLDIGTAKPTAAERAAAPYHGLDLVEPDERYSAGRFAREAAEWIAGIRARGRLPLIVGGTGFYLKALFEGLFEEPHLDPGARAALRRELAGRDSIELERWAKRLDPAWMGGGRQRAQRVIEVALLTGRRLSDLHAEAAAATPRFRPVTFLVTLPRPELHRRIERRAVAMLEAGLVEETRSVLRRGVGPDAPGLSGVGYRQCVDHILGRLPRSELAAAIVTATRRYAKRQETWFRHQLKGPARRLDGTGSPQALARELLAGYRAACESE